jgi:hypothetical protein
MSSREDRKRRDEPTRRPIPAVDFRAGASAGRCFYEVLSGAVAQFPEALAPARLPRDAKAFRADYADALTRFEAARTASAQRVEIAGWLASQRQTTFVYDRDGGAIALSDAVAAPAEPLPLEVIETAGSGGWLPAVPYRGEVHRGDSLRALTDGWVKRWTVAPAVCDAVDWLLAAVRDDAGELDLRGRRVAVLGGAAELAPTLHWLEAGADVLWLDLAAPPADLAKDSRLSGRLHHVPGGVDLLARPSAVRATLERFAADGNAALDLGLYAYAPGRGREWRLAATMNAIVDALPADVVRTVTLLISPSSPGARTADEDAAEVERTERRPAWRRALRSVGLLGRGPGALRVGEQGANRSIVTIQGLSYQAAQYLEKWMTAEAWATDARGLHVSANVAGITQTRSLQHPIFAAAFGGAGAFGVETYAPATTRALMGLLAARDWLDPGAPSHPARAYATPAERAAALSSVRVHGGLYGLPEPLEPALRMAALIGFARRPALLGGLVRR